MHSYDPTLTTAMDRVRFAIGDTESPWQLTNTEIDAMLAKTGGAETPAAIECCRSLVAKYTRKSSNASVGPFSIDYASQANMYRELITELERAGQSAVSPFVSGFDKAAKTANEEDDSITPMHVRVGMHDEPSYNDMYPEDKYGRYR